MKKQAVWRFNIDSELNNDITQIRNQYIQVMGKEPSKTDLINLLMSNFRNRQFSKKRKSKNEIQFI
jgi:hypothetical protein